MAAPRQKKWPASSDTGHPILINMGHPPTPIYFLPFFADLSLITACAAANRAIGTRYGEQLT